MTLRKIEHCQDKAFKNNQTWKPFNEISPHLALAVMSSEDIGFLIHNGFDWKAIENAIDDYKQGKSLRGASTISQQTAKNVFLLPCRSWVRKGFEAYFTFWLEKIWGKKRIIEVYLNVIEFAPGIYGAEAASQHYYKQPAKMLNQREAALLVACLPNPSDRNPINPDSLVIKRANQIEKIIDFFGK